MTMKNILKKALLFCLMTFIFSHEMEAQSTNPKPIRLAIAGMSHGHISFILGRPDKGDFQLVGVYEPNTEMAFRYAQKYGFYSKLIYNDLGKMLDQVKPEAVVAFGSIYEHLAVVETCAPRGIDVMVEKPLAVNVEHAKRMEKLAEKYHIHLLTDYETSWYPSTAKSFQLVNDSNTIGNLTKVIFHDGHQGPKEIGVNKEFLEWLTDPKQNGGGALMDFGCYGANLMTYLMKGTEPISVTAVAMHFKSNIYPKVEDDATIIVTYPETECIIQASWNWPFNRKDMEIYGKFGYIRAINGNEMQIKKEGMNDEKVIHISSKDIQVYEDPFSYFADVIRGKIQMPDYGLYSLKNNQTVVKILDAAKESIKTGKTIRFK
jgi:predicted dehydrogenase